ncbi:hypothetical protein [Aeromicrobium phragmitis]|nr:hypothetical protein [Aeromicrobium phragmitis]
MTISWLAVFAVRALPPRSDQPSSAPLRDIEHARRVREALRDASLARVVR